MDKYLISIIVPVYNISKYLSQCIESIIHQSYTNIEIILVDDGSTDECPDICDRYAKIDDRIKVIHKENGGLVSARIKGLELACGKYIGYVDGDDWIEPDMFERLLYIAEQEKVDVVACGRYEDTGKVSREVHHGIKEGRYNKESLRKYVYPNMIVNCDFFEWGIFPSVWDKLFKRECLISYQMDVDKRLTMGEDAACVYPCMLNIDSLYVLNKSLYHYRQTTSSMVKKVVDFELERNNFSLLYHSVLKKFEQYKNIFDLREQWLEYLLFLMVPRSDTLYKNIEKLDYLFPFPNVKKGSNIVIYGMGTYGQRLYNYLKRTSFCNVLMCADRNYIELCKQGLCVDSPEEISKHDYDAIIVASSFAKARMSIYNDLIKRFPKEKVHIMDVDLIKSDSTLDAFGLRL